MQGAAPEVIGIDAFLWWSTAKSGWRKCDWWLRRRYPAVRNSVMCTNNTYGAMAVQGMAFAFRTREIWPTVVLNEVHPKVLMHALDESTPYPRKWTPKKRDDALDFLRRLGCKFGSNDLPNSEHEFDAILAVCASFEGIQGNWIDLATTERDDRAVYPAGPVTYFWPHHGSLVGDPIH